MICPLCYGSGCRTGTPQTCSGIRFALDVANVASAAVASAADVTTGNPARDEVRQRLWALVGAFLAPLAPLAAEACKDDCGDPLCQLGQRIRVIISVAD